MTPERREVIRDWLGYDPDDQGAAAARELLAELDALRAKVGELQQWCANRRLASLQVAQLGGTIGAEYRAAMLSDVIDQAREIGLFTATGGDQ